MVKTQQDKKSVKILLYSCMKYNGKCIEQQSFNREFWDNPGVGVTAQAPKRLFYSTGSLELPVPLSAIVDDALPPTGNDGTWRLLVSYLPISKYLWNNIFSSSSISSIFGHANCSRLSVKRIQAIVKRNIGSGRKNIRKFFARMQSPILL
jgi:hypothetical protein